MSIEKGKHFPIFLILTEGRTPIVSKVIKDVTHSPFSHASISFDPTLKEIYSFNFGNRGNGFIKENIFTLGRSNNNKIAVFCFFVSSSTKRKIMSSFYDFSKNKDKTRYSFIRLIEKLFNKGKERVKYAQVCSSFVASVLQSANINIAPSDIYLISPGEIHTGIKENKTVYQLYYGPAYNFDAVKIKTKVEKLYLKEKTSTFSNIYTEDIDKLKRNAEYLAYKGKQIAENKPYLTKAAFERQKNIKKNATTLVKQKLKGKQIKKDDILNAIDLPNSIFKHTLSEGLTPEQVDRSNYINFNLFGLFDIYTTDDSLQTNEFFIKKMRWVKERLEELAKQMNAELEPYELTLCGSFEDLDVFYDHKAPKWVTGFTYGNKVYMKSPNIYNGTLYYNIVLHEAIHVLIFNNFKIRGYDISRVDEEGMAVFFSTPLNEWLRELNHGPNWYYYESAIEVQEDYLTGGMEKVIVKRFKERSPK